jgi:two-component system cell cycle sensor histidine kinase/response regulator CckA
MLTIGRRNTVLSMNTAARALIGERVTSLEALSPGPLRSGTTCEITTTRGPAICGFVEIDGTSGRREVFLLPDAIRADPPGGDWALLEAIPVPLVLIESDGRILHANPGARALLRCDPGASCRLADRLEGLGRPVNEWVEDAAAGRGTVQSEFLRVRRDDRETFVQVSLARTELGGKSLLMAVLSDATELKSLQAQFVQSQKMQAIGQLAGGIAHDFNNLLTAISGHCDLLLLHRDPGDPEYADLMQIAQNVNRAAALVGQLLAFSRKQTMRPQILDLRDILADLTHLLNRLVGEQVSLTLDHEPGLAAIRADKRQIEQVIMNLVVNARDAMPEGGEIRIVTRNRFLDSPLYRDRAVVAPGHYVAIEVADTGCGIPPDKVAKVFEPFFTTKRPGEGTGLGLSTAYGIVKQTGGFIFVDSTPGAGTTFQILFPAHAHVSEPEPDSPPTPAAPRPRGGVVLLVEDEAPVRAFAGRALRLRGFTVIEADSAEEALGRLSDTAQQIDVIVSDVIMPGMDGPTWVRQALTQRPELRVVFMSGYAEETFGDVQAQLTNSVFLPKPFSLSDLAETVQRLISPAPP